MAAKISDLDGVGCGVKDGSGRNLNGAGVVSTPVGQGWREKRESNVSRVTDVLWSTYWKWAVATQRWSAQVHSV